MIPPTNIDGTDITGATIDGQDVQEITVDGDTVFTATTVVDDFNDNDMAEYNNLGGQSLVTSPVFEGSHALELTNGMNDVFSLPGDGLQNYPQKGSIIEWYFNLDGNSGQPIFGFGTQDADNTYWAIPDGKNKNQIFITIYQNGSPDNNAFSTPAPPATGWFKNRVIWDDGTLGGSDNDITYEMYDTSDNLLGSGTLNDSTFANESGIDLQHSSNGPSYIDFITIE